MTHERFETLPVWQEAFELAVKTYEMTGQADFRGHGSLRDQIERAAVSVSNNIAEGFERGTTQELLTFLYIARGSAGEVRSMLCLFEQIPEFKNLKYQISNLKGIAENVSRQLRGWAGKLQNSDIKGQRYLTDKVRQAEKSARSQQDFMEKLRRIVEEGSAGRSGDEPDEEAP